MLAGLDDGAAPPLRLRIPATPLDELRIQRLKRILRDHPGDSVVTLDLGTQVLRLSDEFRVDLDRAVGELRMAFGHDAVLRRSRPCRPQIRSLGLRGMAARRPP